MLSRIARLELRARRVVEGFLGGTHRSPYKGFSVEFAAHRPYVPGDDIRHIDWRVYGKADRYFVKQYEEETNLRTHVLLDCSGSMAYADPGQRTHGGGPADRLSKWDYAATLAASLAYLLLQQRDAVGLTLFDQEVRQQTALSTNRRSLGAIAGLIESHAPEHPTDLGAALGNLPDRWPRRGLIVLVSDLLGPPDDVVRALQRFRYRGHDVAVLHVLDHDELNFSFSERTLFEGLEDSEDRVLTDPQSLRDAYLSALEVFLSRIRRACLDHGIDYSLMSTSDRIEVALTGFLARRKAAQRARV